MAVPAVLASVSVDTPRPPTTTINEPTTGVFRQRYFGHVTITQRFRTSEMIGLKAFQNPDELEMSHYIINGQRVSGGGGSRSVLAVLWRSVQINILSCPLERRITHTPPTHANIPNPQATWQLLPHVNHNTCVERALSDCMAKLRRQTYMASLSTATDNGNGNSNGTSSSSNGNGNARSLPPLAPSSASSSRSGTPRRYHLEEAIFPPPPDAFAAASLKRADSGRFDDDGDMLEATTPGRQPNHVPSPLGRREGRESERMRQLEAENAALKLQIDRLSEALSQLLSQTDRGLYHHQVSVCTDGDQTSPRSASPSRVGLGALNGASSSLSVLSGGGGIGEGELRGTGRGVQGGDARIPAEVGRGASYGSSSGSSGGRPNSPSPSLS